MNQALDAETLLTDTTTKPSGDLRITAPIRARARCGSRSACASSRALSDPCGAGVSDEQIAIAMRAADVAIWTSEPQQADLIRRPLFS